MEVRDIARVCHEANRALQLLQADPAIPVAPRFDELDSAGKASLESGVRGVIEGNTPEESHENWLRFKVAAGWVFGPVKDDVEKTHPLLVPYDQLSPAAKVKDALFAAIVEALA